MSKSIQFDGQKLVSHAELRVLIDHISAKFTALEARVTECERTRPVDPVVKEAGDALMADVRRQTLHMERALVLLGDEPVDVASIVHDGAIPTNDLTGDGLVDLVERVDEMMADGSHTNGGAPLIEVVER